jgi:uncharacterized membrane protein HdeD (DUF308 family)
VKIAIAASAMALPMAGGGSLPISVGWMLLAGGLAEFALGWGAHRAMLGKVTLGSGLLTVITGIVFINASWSGLFTLTAASLSWLLLRGAISLGIGLQARFANAPDWFWLVLRGLTDLALGATLLLGLPMAMVVILLFRETHEMISHFGLLLAISFAVAGVGLVAMGLSQRRREAALLGVSETLVGEEAHLSRNTGPPAPAAASI